MLADNDKPLFLQPDIGMRKEGNGIVYLTSNHQLGPLPDTVISYLIRWSEQKPDSIFLAERNANAVTGWDTLSYGDAFTQACCLADNLHKNTNLAKDCPLLILSGNSIASALMVLACYLLAVPVVPVSPSYSLLSKDFVKVKYIQDLVKAGLVFAENYHSFQSVLEMLEEEGVKIMTADIEPPKETILNFSILEERDKAASCHLRNMSAKPTDIAKILFTSGSTGMPKGVINTHKMLVSNQEAMAQIWPFIEKPGHVFLDWLPWHHTFGGNHNFNMVLRNGGTMYIDEGMPTPDGIKATLDNLARISPTVYFNVTSGYVLLLNYLEKDSKLAERFFRKLELLFFAAAALPMSVRERLQALIDRYSAVEIPITSSWGATETAPACTSVYFSNVIARNIGVPLPGTDVKLVPCGEMMELRVKGSNIMPGYWKDEEKTKSAFDDEGYFCSGDAVELIDSEDPAKGLAFVGRISENFKLQTGTWVNVGDLRVRLLESLPSFVSDIVICGHDEAYISILIFTNVKQCLKYVKGYDPALIAYNKGIKAKIFEKLISYNLKNYGSSKRVRKALILTSPPSIDDNEMTDKGYLNQRGVIKNRADKVALFYAGGASHETVILLPE